MNMKTLRLWPLAAVLLTGVASAEESIAAKLMESKSCSENSSSQSRTCTYRIDSAFWVEITDIGSEYAAVHFMKSDYEEAPYYGSFATASGCVNVTKKGSGDDAYISPKNGKIYKIWTECRDETLK